MASKLNLNKFGNEGRHLGWNTDLKLVYLWTMGLDFIYQGECTLEKKQKLEKETR